MNSEQTQKRLTAQDLEKEFLYCKLILWHVARRFIGSFYVAIRRANMSRVLSLLIIAMASSFLMASPNGVDLMASPNGVDNPILPSQPSTEGVLVNHHSDCSGAESAGTSLLMITSGITYTYDNTTSGTLTNQSNCSTSLVRTFTVTDNFTVNDLNVGLNFSHTWRGDVRVNLTSPLGTTVTLIVQDNGDSYDHQDFMMDDESSNAINNGNNNNTGTPNYDADRSVAPDNSLSTFDGQNALGTWTLEFCNVNQGGSGGRVLTYNSARLLFDGTPVVEICNNGIDDDGDGLVDNSDSDCSYLFLEPECATIGANWNVVTDVSASNGNYLAIQSGLNSTSSAPTGVADRISFTFNMAFAGNYKVFGRVKAPNGNDDSFWVRVNGGTWYQWNNLSTVTDWTWLQVHDSNNSNTPVLFNMSNGSNTIDIAYREDGTLLDKIYITATGSAPSGIGEDATNCFVPEICGNGLDDDGDGLIDCADADCGTPISPNAGTDASICAGGNTSLAANASGGIAPYTFVWNNDLGNGATKTVNPVATTTYTVTVTAANGCSATDQVSVVVHSPPAVGISTATTICAGASSTITASATGNSPFTYSWSNGLGSGDTKTVSPLSTTTYTVTVTDANGCTNTKQTTVTVSSKPVANAGADVTICNSFNTTITASALGGTTPYSYIWDNGLGNGASHTVTPSSTKTYAVTVVSANGCVSSDQVTVTVQSCPENCGNGLDDDGDGFIDCADSDCGPQVDLGGGIFICNGSTASLSATVTGGNGGLTYAWSNGLGSGQNKTVTPSTTTTYSVTVSSQSGCTDAAQVTVTVKTCSEICTNGIDDDGDGLIDCDDPDCSGVTAPVLVDDSFSTCPGMTFTERVTYNDGNLQNPSFSISSQPVNGFVNIDWTGKFTYLPFSTECSTDFFIYEVCNGTTGCCSEATVTMNFGDSTPPVLSNVPADITIGCDDVLPLPGIVTAFDQCPGIYMDFNEISSQLYQGACGSYSVTRTWTATDLCGNSATDQQKITVLDQTKPEIFQVYTLANGTRVVAGVSQRVTGDWKYVPFPITFSQAPVVFTTVVTNTDFSAVSVQERNINTQGFEIRVREEEGADHIHVSEKVAWLAIEPSSQTGGFAFQAGTVANAGHEWDTLNFSSVFSEAPLLFTSLQTTKEKDPVTVRQRNLNSNSVEFFTQEETSLDAETDHQNETLGILAIERNNLMKDREGEQFGEMSQINLTNAWTTVSLNRKYTKPVVIVGGLTNNDGDPINIRVRNVTSTSFQLRVQEWDYLDGNHGSESVSWMVVEGSIPGNGAFYCSGNAADLRPGVNVFAMDNCDDIVAFGYNESPSAQTGGGLLTVRSWMAIDNCGNTNLISRYDTCATAALQVKAMLFGAIMSNNGATELMRDNLREQKKLPVFEPYSKLPAFNHIEYEEHVTLPQGNGGGNTGTPDVTICHKPGTADEATMTVSVSELALHLGHGDMIGSCGSENSGLITICHQPGTAAQNTTVIPQASLLGHLGHGDIIGDCGGGVSEVNSAAQSAGYRTIADGIWTDAATWESGNVPPTTNIASKTISVEHKVTIQNSDLDMGNGSTLWVTHGSLTLLNGVFKIEKSAAYFSNSVLDMTTAGNVEVNNSLGVLSFVDCTVMVGQNIKNQGGKLKLENVSLNVSEDFENLGGKDTLLNVCAIIQGNFKSYSSSTNYFSNVKMQLPNGGFENLLLSSMTGDSLILLVESGVLSNLGDWSASVLQYCVAGSLSGLLSGVLPAYQDCVDIANYFNPCNCDDEADEGGNNSGGSGSNTGGAATASEDDDKVNHGNSFGGGSIEPTVLDIAGNDAIVDWLLLELRSPDDYKVVMGYAAVLLQRDGSIVGENQDSIIVFPGLPEGDYYVAIRHRNHLGMMTDVPFYLSSQNVPEIDFTDLSLPVRGGNIGGKLNGGKRMLWSGDFSEDGKVIYQGPYNDVFNLFSKVLSEPANNENLANYIVQGYELEDLNLDGKVIFQGPNNDRFTLLYHTILSHPLNVNNLANYIVKMP